MRRFSPNQIWKSINVKDIFGNIYTIKISSFFEIEVSLRVIEVATGNVELNEDTILYQNEMYLRNNVEEDIPLQILLRYYYPLARNKNVSREEIIQKYSSPLPPGEKEEVIERVSIVERCILQINICFEKKERKINLSYPLLLRKELISLEIDKKKKCISFLERLNTTFYYHEVELIDEILPFLNFNFEEGEFHRESEISQAKGDTLPPQISQTRGDDSFTQSDSPFYFVSLILREVVREHSRLLYRRFLQKINS